MSCANECDHVLALHSVHGRAKDFNLDQVRAVLCLTCTSAMRDYKPTRTERLTIWRRLRDVILPEHEVQETILYSVPFKIPRVQDGKSTPGSLYIRVTFDEGCNMHNVFVAVSRAGRGLGNAAASIGRFVHHMCEWGAPWEEISALLVGHGRDTGAARWSVMGEEIYSIEDAVGQCIRLAHAGWAVGEFLLEAGRTVKIIKIIRQGNKATR